MVRHKFACIDHVPEGAEPVLSQSQMKKKVNQKIQDSILQGNLSSSNRKKVEQKTFSKLKASFIKNAIWPTNKPIRIHFMDGTQKQKDWVMKVVKEKLEPVVSKLKFEWNVPISESDIRITFNIPGQAWSYIGTQNKLIRQNEETMSLGWIDDDTQYDSPVYKNTGVVVLHEFGHMLGMIHEHQNPKGNKVTWNKEMIYAELARTNGWDKENVDNNIFKRYGDKELCEKTKTKPDYDGKELDIAGYCGGEEVNGSKYDVNSIMHYFYPAEWILEGPKEIPKNTQLSAMDKHWLAKYYGNPDEYPVEAEEDVTDTGEEVEQITLDEVDTKIVEELEQTFESFLHRRSLGYAFHLSHENTLVGMILVFLVFFVFVEYKI